MSNKAVSTKKRRAARAKRLAMMGAVSATAVTVGLTPAMANAASSQTYFIGFPDWLPIGEGATLPSDPVAINNAMVGAKDTNPLIAWGLGAVNLQPVWVKYVDGVPVYTVPKIGQTGSHTETNPLYQPAYNAAYDVAYQLASRPTWLGGCGGNAQCRHDRATADALSAVRNIAQTITVPDYGITEPGNWTTPTAGQWINPTDLSGVPALGLVDYFVSGDRGYLAPVLNWTAYLTNVNLIAYGDGAIAAGQAYQAFIDSAKGNTHEGYDPFTVGAPQTDPRQIRIVGPNGEVTLVTVYETNNPLDYPNPTYPGQTPQPGYEVVQPGGVVDLTVLSLVLVRNPGRANGGLYARFAPVYEELTGVNPVTPERQDVLPEGIDPELITKLLTGNAGDISLDELGNLKAVIESVDGEPIIVTLKADVGWQYDLMSDAPATANPIAWANSVASSVFLTNLLTGVDFQDLGDGASIGPDGTLYYTLPVDELPLLAPMRLPAQVIGLATGNPDVNTPLADAIEPALKMLVNLGYTDVVRNPDGTYTRTLDKFGEPTLFGTPTLTREQMALVPGDLIAALGAGFGDEMTDVLLRTKRQLTEALKVEMTDEQDEAVEQSLSAPGNTIKNVSHDLGNSVSQVLTAVESELPEAPAVTQDDLEEGQRKVGRQLADTRDQLNETVSKVQSVIGDGRNTVTTANTSHGGENGATPSTTRKTPVKDALQKANSDIKKTVTRVRNQVKKAFGGDKDSDGSGNGDGGEGGAQ
jgi:PE-PPE domain